MAQNKNTIFNFELMLDFKPPIQKITNQITEGFGIDLYLLRLDLNHPQISGNKIYKLKYNIEEAKKLEKQTLLTFGGAFSNHIAATAAAGKELGFSTIGIIRGDELSELNPTLKLAKENGMQLHFVSRELYRDKELLYKYVEDKFKHENYYLIPEGGSNELGVKGCMEIVHTISIDFDTICCACGTGATLAGIVMSLKEKQKAIGFQVLKAEGYINNEIIKWLNCFNKSDKTNWKVNEDFHFGGYAKSNKQLIDFIIAFEKEQNIPLESIYTGKMMYALFELINQNYFKKGETIVAVHTGGLQYIYTH